VQRVAIAAIYAGLNDDDRALQWLEEGGAAAGANCGSGSLSILCGPRMRTKTGLPENPGAMARGSGEVTYRQA
jgi:hypothetical protein